jgi:hypothetical protein
MSESNDLTIYGLVAVCLTAVAGPAITIFLRNYNISCGKSCSCSRIDDKDIITSEINANVKAISANQAAAQTYVMEIRDIVIDIQGTVDNMEEDLSSINRDNNLVNFVDHWQEEISERARTNSDPPPKKKKTKKKKKKDNAELL